MAHIEWEHFGKTPAGEDVTKYILKNDKNVSVHIITYGGIITNIFVPDRGGKLADVVLGFDDMTGYTDGRSRYFGALIGRVANRIAKGKFTLDGKEYSLFINNGPNSLHGGKIGFDKKLWESKMDGNKIILKYTSPDGEEGYPGEVTAVVTYELTARNELIIDFTATTTKATPINLTNHSYFNLAGQGSGRIDDHVAQIFADSYLPIDEFSIPTGEKRNVDGTEFDLRKPVRLGERLAVVREGQGYDNNFNLEWIPGTLQLRTAARVEHPASGRTLVCSTTEPGVQFYTAGSLTNMSGKGGAVYDRFGAFCLETQHYPDSVHHDNFPTTILRPGETYRHTTHYKFGMAA